LFGGEGKEGDWSSADDKTPETDWASFDAEPDIGAGEGDWSRAFDFAVGGVVPSAAGGMKVDDGKGGTLATLSSASEKKRRCRNRARIQRPTIWTPTSTLALSRGL